jgi:class 3 adenylate cyclase/tetratricopeptide (TPR) repeat protein
MICPACSTENRTGRKFCSNCGAPLALACPACGAANEPDDAFCGECGASLTAEAPAAAAAPAAERRLVTVLFADLVGFTPLSEKRDAEEVRDFLSRYFDACRRLIELYGGTVEKFIGDAVMAVWGAPAATEDDAERAVRAALDLVTAVSALGEELGAEDLRARAGVLTGEAAVTVGAQGEGMVAGDLVNTASRVQTVAEPGSVYVGESTMHATSDTIVYEDAGTFELKGKEEPVRLWQAKRVVSGLRGSLKSQGLEAPFVGRERELRQIKDLFHNAAEAHRAHLVSVTGIAGIGKSRLAWEFYKYFDGIAESVYWHRGRCLPYGEGVTYWALADMVRMRCRIAEDEEPASAGEKLHTTLEEHLLDAEERRFVEPRLAHLLGLSEHHAHDKQDLFGAWRLFFERLAETYPTVLVFEDLQWGDASLLEFVEYLLDWSRSHALFVVSLARPELLERVPTWGAAQRNFTSLYLDPLPEEAMAELLGGLVPGLPDDLRDRILERAEGVPLYAVETVRMLLDRGLLVEEGAAYRLTGAVEELKVPETLHALIAARLDGLSAEERGLLQDAAVLGKTFPKQALAALSGAGDELDPLLSSLVRKEVLGVQADARSPEHGHYGFLQDLVRRVAYETLPRRERRAKHLAAAEYLATTSEEDEVVEVIASHYLDALEAVPDAEDAEEVKRRARETLGRAGERAASLAAAGEAQRYFEHAAGLADARLDRAALLERAGEMAGHAADPVRAAELLKEAMSLYEGEGDTHAAARSAGTLGRYLAFTDRRAEGIALMERAFETISKDEPDEHLALLAARLASAYWFSGDLDRARERVELALDIAEAHGFPEPLVIGLRMKSAVVWSAGHSVEAGALSRRALDLALEHGLHELASTIYFGISDGSFRSDRYGEALGYLEESLALARKTGSRTSEWSVLAEMTYPLTMLGRWDEAMAIAAEFDQDRIDTGGVMLSLLTGPVEIHLQRGHVSEARDLLSLFSRAEASGVHQEQAAYVGARASLHLAEGRLAEAIADAEAVLEDTRMLGFGQQSVKQVLVAALEAATALGDDLKAQELLAVIESEPPGRRAPFLVAQAHRFRARLDGDDAAYDESARILRDLELPFWLAVTLLEQGEHLDEAREIFERLGATPWLERFETTPSERQPIAT